MCIRDSSLSLSPPAPPGSKYPCGAHNKLAIGVFRLRALFHKPPNPTAPHLLALPPYQGVHVPPAVGH
eukprot:4687964-Alexandrium_andersonii.AAC.1